MFVSKKGLIFVVWILNSEHGSSEYRVNEILSYADPEWALTRQWLN
jgi:hypothetical protein